MVRMMLSTHPYTTWPLHVKLFTVDALRAWIAADTSTDEKSHAKSFNSLTKSEALNNGTPTGLTVSVELEGVDGKGPVPAGVQSARDGPIEATDGMVIAYSFLEICSLTIRSLTKLDLHPPIWLNKRLFLANLDN